MINNEIEDYIEFLVHLNPALLLLLLLLRCPHKKVFYGFNFETNYNIYKKIGVKHFKKIVPFGDYWISCYNRLFSKNLKLFKSKENAIIWVIFTLSVEFIHLIGLIIFSCLSLRFYMNQEFEELIISIGTNIVINLYPICVQRFNRIRLIRTYNITFNNIHIIHI